jgi:propanol-preferring alcohol dehydrogenase
MRALQLVEPTVLAITDVPVPVPADDEVLLKVRGAGLCHSDLHLRQVPIEVFPLPLTPGHEVAGTATKWPERSRQPGGALVVSPAVMQCSST